MQLSPANVLVQHHSRREALTRVGCAGAAGSAACKIWVNKSRLWCKASGQTGYFGVLCWLEVATSKLKTVDGLFAGRYFGRDAIILRLRWYLRFKLSLRDLMR